ncbi:nickel pincer cofactor biosynthesis protein LarC [Streptomyces sp. MAR4 CNX-425]|uniref:nickel pincer cofactor biosynthesis protein LarC n=1 Tax=Streptomyces sp. MAR4 CNX-425 TaxID=3406343 RepID=UPI003B5085F5
MAEHPAAAHLDCTAGVAGDMLLGALLDAGARLDTVRNAVAALGIDGLDVSLARDRRGGFACARATVHRPAAADHHRRLGDVLADVERATRAGLSEEAAAFAGRVFRLLAEAEGKAHGTAPEDVHFHEVGAFDALADVVGCAAALAELGLLAPDAAVSCSPLAAGSGEVDCAHGRMPVPVPAVLHLAATGGLALTGGTLAGERTTPTGAALVAALAAPGPLPDMAVRAVGTGGGSRDTPDRPNITRVVTGTRAAPAAPRGGAPAEGEVTVVESTVDDLDPRLWPSVLAALRAAGAWDCWTTETVGRHGRPGRVVTALCAADVRPAVADALFRHTTTLGVRWSARRRLMLPRQSAVVEVGPPGAGQPVTVKVADGPGGALTVQPELAEAETAAAALGWPVRAVCEAAAVRYRGDLAAPRPATG